MMSVQLGQQQLEGKLDQLTRELNASHRIQEVDGAIGELFAGAPAAVAAG